MAVNEICLPVGDGKQAASNRILGTIGMICAPGLFLASFFYSQDQSAPNPYQVFASLLGIVYLGGIAASAIGLKLVEATGSGRGSRVLLAVQLTGLFLAMMFDVFEATAPGLRESWLFFIADMAYPFSHLLMIVVGVAIVRAGVWRGWRRVPAFLCGLALPLFIAASLLVGREAGGFVFPLLVTAGFFSLGFAVRTSRI